MDKPIRLTKRIARTGRYSRHEADKLVSQGLVYYNGVQAIPGTQVPETGGEILVDGELLGENEYTVYAFHKPVGYLSSYHDPNGKKNLSSFPKLAERRLGYSGRLDYDSEGLMLFTADGDLVYKLQRSEFAVEKEYIVNVDKDIDQEWIDVLKKGIEHKDEQFLPCFVEYLEPKKYRVILTEGKKRQVRRMFKSAGSIVIKLLRIRIGTVLLGDLVAGEIRPLLDIEVEKLKKL